jgi:hypothetical protein
MKIIDKTPLLNEKGELGFTQRFQGMMDYGWNWPGELQAQQAIITYFDKQLEKGYTLIRNYTLGKSVITVPIILLGPSGIQVIYIAYLKGRYEARGEEWNVASGEGYKPAPDNLVYKTLRMAKAVRSFIVRQGVEVPVEIEPVLIAGDPGLHIESVKPAVRVMMIDGVKSFVSNLVTTQPVLRPETVYELTERILNPHPAKKTVTPAPAAVAAAAASAPALVQVDPVAARAQAIFKASEDLKPFDLADFDPADLEFAVEDEDLFERSQSPVSSPAAPAPTPAKVDAAPQQKPRPGRFLGMTVGQWAILAVLAVAFLCIAAGFVYYILALA